MKRTLLIGTMLMMLTGTFYLTKKDATETAVHKNINVEVYKTASYVSPAYKNTTATLEVTVVRVNGNAKDTVWQHSFQPTELKDFPEADKPITQKIDIPNVNDCKERLEVYYKVTYNSNGSILNQWNYTTIGQGQQTGKLNIQI